jgi:hypothetical protein
MEWLGLSGVAFAACALGFGALVVLLYLLREQRRQVIVPALALWEGVLRSRAQAALATRLRRMLSLLIALSILACLLFALADLRAHSQGRGRQLLILIDRSASMSASDEPGGRLAAAKRLPAACCRACASRWPRCTSKRTPSSICSPTATWASAKPPRRSGPPRASPCTTYAWAGAATTWA